MNKQNISKLIVMVFLFVGNTIFLHGQTTSDHCEDHLNPIGHGGDLYPGIINISPNFTSFPVLESIEIRANENIGNLDLGNCENLYLAVYDEDNYQETGNSSLNLPLGVAPILSNTLESSFNRVTSNNSDDCCLYNAAYINVELNLQGYCNGYKNGGRPHIKLLYKLVAMTQEGIYVPYEEADEICAELIFPDRCFEIEPVMSSIDVTCNFDDRIHHQRMSEERIQNIGLGHANLFSKISILPNPVLHHFQVNIYANHNEQITLTLFNLQGQLVYQEYLSLFYGFNTHSINMQSYSSGSYYLKLRSNDEVRVLKVVKHKG